MNNKLNTWGWTLTQWKLWFERDNHQLFSKFWCFVERINHQSDDHQGRARDNHRWYPPFSPNVRDSPSWALRRLTVRLRAQPLADLAVEHVAKAERVGHARSSPWDFRGSQTLGIQLHQTSESTQTWGTCRATNVFSRQWKSIHEHGHVNYEHEMSRLSMSTLGIKPGLDDEHEPMSNIIGSLNVKFLLRYVCVCVTYQEWGMAILIFMWILKHATI